MSVDGVVSKLNNRYVIAVIVFLFLLGIIRRFVGR